MNILVLVWNYLKARPFNTVINILLLSLGIAVITLLLLFNRQLEEKITENSRGIDLVVGAKGSPLQLILCNIFHIDFPTGNISLSEAEKTARSRFVKKAIPLALGDSYQSYRIIGTTQDYPELYHAEIAGGKWFKNNLEVTVGSTVAAAGKLEIGDQFSSAHGLAEGGHEHNEHQYQVVGILKPTYTVIDNLILTNVESIWQMHEEQETIEEDEHDAEHQGDHAGDHNSFDETKRSPLVPSVMAGDSLKQITSMLIKYRSSMAAIQLPRLVNSQSSLQAASPAVESARLFSIMGVGVDILLGFGYVLLIISGLSIFIALYNSLKERRYDMAILRSMGASRFKLFFSILLEGGLLSLFGSVVGLMIGHGVVVLTTAFVPQLRATGISGTIFYAEEWIILVGSLLLGLLSALIPAIQAYRTEISKVLAGN